MSVYQGSEATSAREVRSVKSQGEEDVCTMSAVQSFSGCYPMIVKGETILKRPERLGRSFMLILGLH